MSRLPADGQAISQRASQALCARVVAAGDCPPDLLQTLPGDDLLVCVDGGLRHCLQAGLQPDWLVGDLDSASPDDLAATDAVQRFRFPVDKNASDLQLALELLVGLGLRDVVVYGASGGRTDHFLFNWLLPLQRHWPFTLHYEDASVAATVVRADRPVCRSVVPGTVFSVLALQRAAGVRISGARWPLQAAVLEPGDTHGLSNEASAGQIEIGIASGLVLLMVNR